MYIALICTDKANALETRKSNRDAHLAYIAETGVVAMAGPLLNDAAEMAGSLVILDVEDKAAAESWAANDPYAKAGLFSDVRIQPWKKVIG
ncbi:YciI family protein [uncultured Lentibacter sp.]|uniref:YciI family protein n=1 Tax=uncultured Lentibacter sp. TaxID=1659309 RepID=UPI0026395EA1|nr:YciI family protein [uncultured Lentibacter sp.]